MAQSNLIPKSDWIQPLKQYLNKSWWKHISCIILNLEAVNQGLKPAYLWDVGKLIEPGQLLQLINDLKECGLLHQDIHVMSAEKELIVFDIKEVLKHLRTVTDDKNVSDYYFVDVSASLESAVVLESGASAREHIDKMLRTVCEKILEFCEGVATEEVLCLHPEDTWCVPTLLGVLLGYPAVYWYKAKASGVDTCLPYAPLGMHRVKAATSWFPGRADFEIYSFSIPCSVRTVLEEHVERWFCDKVSLAFAKQNVFTKLNRECKTVILPSVIL